MTITDDLSLTGLGADDLTISGNDASRVFSIGVDVAVDIWDVTIADGQTDAGGGICNDGTLTVTNSALTGHYAADNGGSIWNGGVLKVTDSEFSDNSSWNNGGAVWNTGTLDIVNGTFSRNTTGGNGGGIANHYGGTLTVTGSSFEGNSAGTGGTIDSYGGVIGSPSPLQVSKSTFTNNEAGTGGISGTTARQTSPTVASRPTMPSCGAARSPITGSP